MPPMDLNRWTSSKVYMIAIMYTFDDVQRLRSIGGIRSLCFSPDQNELAVGGMGHVGNVDGLGGKARIEWFNPSTGQQTDLFESDTHHGECHSQTSPFVDL